MTIKLRELQENLQAYVLSGDSKITDNIVNPSEDEVDVRLAIYRDAYYLNLTNILRKHYPLLEPLLNEQAFEELAATYIDHCPSHYFSINEFGKRLPLFLQTTAPYSEKPYLAELATLCWELDNVLIAADAPVLTVNDLAAIPQNNWGDLQLITHPSVKLLTQHYNTFALWQALQQDQPAPAMLVLSKPAYCLVWRNSALIPYCCELTAEAACILNGFQAQQTFAEVCEQLADYLPAEEVAQYAVNQLVNWLNQGIFAKLQF